MLRVEKKPLDQQIPKTMLFPQGNKNSSTKEVKRQSLYSNLSTSSSSSSSSSSCKSKGNDGDNDFISSGGAVPRREKREAEIKKEEYKIEEVSRNRYTQAALISLEAIKEILLPKQMISEEILIEILELVPWQGLSYPNHTQLENFIADVVWGFCLSQDVKDDFIFAEQALDKKCTPEVISKYFQKFCREKGYSYEHEIYSSFQELRDLDRLARLLTIAPVTSEDNEKLIDFPVCAVALTKNSKGLNELLVGYNDLEKSNIAKSDYRQDIINDCSSRVAFFKKNYLALKNEDPRLRPQIIDRMTKIIEQVVDSRIKKKDMYLGKSVKDDIIKLMSSSLMEKISIIEDHPIILCDYVDHGQDKIHAELHLIREISRRHLVNQISVSNLRLVGKQEKMDGAKVACSSGSSADKKEQFTLFPQEEVMIGVSMLNCANCSGIINCCKGIVVTGTHNICYPHTIDGATFFKSIFSDELKASCRSPEQSQMISDLIAQIQKTWQDQKSSAVKCHQREKGSNPLNGDPSPLKDKVSISRPLPSGKVKCSLFGPSSSSEASGGSLLLVDPIQNMATATQKGARR